MTKLMAEITPVVDLTQEMGAGPRRWRRPVYTDLMPPCNDACPAGENIQGWLALVQAGKFRGAWELLMRDNPMPSVHGRVCYHPCETACNRAELDSTLTIHAVERFLGDLAASEGWRVPTAPGSGKRVLVIGAGPSGLSAAYHLARLGHEVEIHDAGPLPGGMLHFGIPSYRLPRNVLMKEIGRMESMGVHIVLDHKVEDALGEMEGGGFDALFVAVGADIGKHVEIPARDAGKVLDAITLLHQVETGEAPLLGRRVVVYGGGNTAMDAARTLRRLGASEPLIIYRRDRTHMPAHAFELDEALDEGVKVKWLSTIKKISGSELTAEEMRLDEEGKPQPTGKLETLTADAVVLALGQETDSGFLRKVPGIDFASEGTVTVGPNMMTGHPGIFAGGDMTPSERTVTTAVGHGKKAEADPSARCFLLDAHAAHLHRRPAFASARASARRARIQLR
jgi:formate dehydrogenase (NADP+) beta subunit